MPFGNPKESLEIIKHLEDVLKDLYQQERKIICQARQELGLSLDVAAIHLGMDKEKLYQMEQLVYAPRHEDYIFAWLDYLLLLAEKQRHCKS